MAVKFNRGYKLIIDGINGNTITIDYTQSPLTLEFDVQRNNFASTNLGSFKLYNLSKQTRDLIWKAPADVSFSRRVRLYVGYGTNSALYTQVFFGSIKQAWSFRDGSSFVTQIEGFDGGDAYANAYVPDGFTMSTSDTYAGIAAKLFTYLGNYGITSGIIGSQVTGSPPITKQVHGKVWDVLRSDEFASSGFFVDMETAYMLSAQYNLGNTPFVVSSQTGLLGTPLIQSSTTVTCQLLLWPQVLMKQQVALNSETFNPLANKIFTVNGLQHRGIISPTVGGEAITTLTLYTPAPITYS